MAFPEDVLSDDERVVMHLHPHWKALIWPVIKNYRVYQGGTFGDRDLWLDPNEAPLKKGS